MAVNPSLSDVKSEVDSQISNQNSRADSAINNATTFLTDLRDAALTGVPSTVFIDPVISSISGTPLLAYLPSRPTTTLDEIKARVASPPEDNFAPASFVTNYPEINDNTVSAPDVNIPDAPTFTEELSAEVPYVDSVSNATAPAESVPDKLDGIGSYTIPSPPAVVIPTFGATLPTYSLEVPTTPFAYVEPEYTSALKDALTAKLLSDVENGGTGLSSDVEDAIWERTRERDDKDYVEAAEKLDSRWAGKGFSLPSGVLVELHQDLIVDDRNQRVERSRDILIKQAELAQVNTHFSITSSLSLEQLELNHANEIYNRALEAEKSVIEFGIAYHNLKIADYNAQMERYKAAAIEQSSRLEAEKLRLDAYRTELLEVEAKSRLDKDLLSEYNHDLERYNNLLKLFAAEQGAVTTGLGIEGLKIDFYKANIDNHRAKVSAQSAEFDSHTATVNGELGKVKLYEAELSAEKLRVDTLSTITDTEIAKLNENIKLQELDLRAFVANVDKYKAVASIANTELATEVSLYGHDIARYASEVGRAEAEARLDMEAAVKTQALELQNANIRLENAKANLQSELSTIALRIDASKGIADAYTSMVNAIVSGFSAIASIESGGLSRENEEV